MNFILFFINFFSFKIFLQQHENMIKSNNKTNNYINQLLRLPLLKYTHTYKKIEMLKKKKKKSNTILPPQDKKRTPTTPQMEVPTAAVKE